MRVRIPVFCASGQVSDHITNISSVMSPSCCQSVRLRRLFLLLPLFGGALP